MSDHRPSVSTEILGRAVAFIVYFGNANYFGEFSRDFKCLTFPSMYLLMRAFTETIVLPIPGVISIFNYIILSQLIFFV